MLCVRRMGVVSFIPKFKILYSVVILLVSRVFYMCVCVCVYICLCVSVKKE